MAAGPIIESREFRDLACLVVFSCTFVLSSVTLRVVEWVL